MPSKVMGGSRRRQVFCEAYRHRNYYPQQGSWAVGVACLGFARFHYFALLVSSFVLRTPLASALLGVGVIVIAIIEAGQDVETRTLPLG